MNYRFLLALLALFVGLKSLPAEGQPTAETKTILLAGGCFWCMQEPFDHVPGVVKTVVGYTGGSATDATYDKVSAHKTQHRESIEVTYNPAKISFAQLLEVYFQNINPTQADGQFGDIGLSYQAAIYFANDEEKKLAEAAKDKLGKSGKFQKPIATEILPAGKFFPAEDYHQKYYQKNPADYEAYHVGSGRVTFRKKYWGN